MPPLPHLGRRSAAVLSLLALVLAISPAVADDWPQWMGPQRDGIWREKGVVRKLPARPITLWRTPIHAGYAGPAVAGGKVYVMDRKLNPGQTNPATPFDRANSKGVERVVCLDAKTGKQLWAFPYDCTYTISYPSGPRVTPTVHNGKVYSLGAVGDLYCLDASTGKKLWHRNFPKEFGAPVPVWGFASHPLIDGDKVITLAGGKGSAVVAFNKDTGKVVWKSGTVEDIGYAPPIIYKAGGKRQLIVFQPLAVRGLDPQTGKEYWSRPIQAAFNMSIAAPQKMGNQLFVASYSKASMLLKLAADKPDATVLWRGNPGRTSIHPCFATPHVEDGHIYGVDSNGVYRCVNAEGKHVWSSLSPIGGTAVNWGNVFQVKNGDRFFLTNEHGEVMVAKMSPKGYEEFGRAKVIEPTTPVGRDRKVLWVHPAYANRCLYLRNDNEILCVSLAE